VPISLSPAPEDHEAVGLIAGLIASHHPDLQKHEVTVGVVLATTDDPDKPAVKLHGYPCAAVVSITPYKQRIHGVADALITIDAANWDDLSERQRESLIAHELTHLTVATDRKGYAKADDAGRPKLRMRLHDVQVGWFMSIAERYGEDSYEVQQARDIQDKHGQLLFSWAEGVIPMERRKAV
jgi:hypothetical protein